MIQIEIFEIVDSLQKIFDELFARLEIAHVMLLNVTDLIDKFRQVSKLKKLTRDKQNAF